MAGYRLDKFFRSHADIERAEELDFFTAAETLETTTSEKRREIPPEQFDPLLEKNKDGFATATTPGVETLLPSNAAGGGHEAIILKRLRARSFRNADVLSAEGRKFWRCRTSDHRRRPRGQDHHPQGEGGVRQDRRPRGDARHSPQGNRPPGLVGRAQEATRMRRSPRAKSSFPLTCLDVAGNVMV
jgi:hypothetical protein